MEIVRNEFVGHDFIFRIGQSESSSLSTRVDTAKWIIRKLATIVPIHLGMWSVVWEPVPTEIRLGDSDDDSNEDSDDESHDGACVFDVLAHLDTPLAPPTTKDGFVLLSDIPVRLAVDCKKIKRAFRVDPVKPVGTYKVGISGVRGAVMARHWWNVIGGSDGQGKAPMLTSCYSFIVQEGSAMFGWENYPPKDNNDGILTYEGLD